MAKNKVAKITKKSKPEATKYRVKITREKVRELLERGSKKITEADIKRVTDKSEEIRKKFESEGLLSRFIEDAKILLSIVRDYWNGTYRGIPFWSLAAIIFALLYVLTPIDLIPDFILGVGYIDDALVISVCLLMVETDLHDYKEWKINSCKL